MTRLVLLLLFIAAGQAHAQSWPQWRGPNRDALCQEKGLLSQWPEEGPKLLWQVDDLGGGYSTPTFGHGLIFGMSYVGDDEVVWARDIKNGKLVWQEKIAAANRVVDYKEGSRCSPTIDGERLYVLGVSGDLVCLTIKGAMLWRKNLIDDFGGILPFYRDAYGYTESPFIDGDMVLATPGGDKNTIVALDKKTGKHLWSAPVPQKRFKGDNRADYSSMVAGEVGGVRQYVQFLHGCVVGVSTEGKLLWRWDKPSNDIANCNTPILKGDLVYACAGYGSGGSGLLKIVPRGKEMETEQLWYNKAMRNIHGGAVWVKDHIYGNNDAGMLVCLEAKSGKVAWQERAAGKGAVLYADGHLYYRVEDGDMLLVEANPAKYVEKGRFTPGQRSKKRAWAHPVIVDGKMYLRDQEYLLCYEVKK